MPLDFDSLPFLTPAWVAFEQGRTNALDLAERLWS